MSGTFCHDLWLLKYVLLLRVKHGATSVYFFCPIFQFANAYDDLSYIHLIIVNSSRSCTFEALQVLRKIRKSPPSVLRPNFFQIYVLG